VEDGNQGAKSASRVSDAQIGRVDHRKKHVSGKPTLPANLCPFSWRREVTCFDEDFGEAVGEAVEPNANSVV
jgi:hypothetical protein